jgi:hypothetical protein
MIMLLRVQRPSGCCTSLIIIEAGDALSTRAPMRSVVAAKVTINTNVFVISASLA